MRKLVVQFFAFVAVMNGNRAIELRAQQLFHRVVEYNVPYRVVATRHANGGVVVRQAKAYLTSVKADLEGEQGTQFRSKHGPMLYARGGH